MIKILTARTFEICFNFDVSVNGGAVGVIQFPTAPIIPVGAIYQESYFQCTTSFVSSGGGTFDLETTVQALIYLNVLPIAGKNYLGNIPTPPLYTTNASDGSPFFVTIYTAPLQAGAGVFFNRYSIIR
jgi:hypothetical protein